MRSNGRKNRSSTKIGVKSLQNEGSKRPFECIVRSMRGTGSCWGSRELAAVRAARVATHRPIMLLVSAYRDLSQAAPLGFDALGASIDRTPAPMHGHDQADNPGDQPPV